MDKINLDDLPPSMIPEEIVELLREIPAHLDEAARYRLERLVEWSYHSGYAAGYPRGHADGIAVERRSEPRGAHVRHVLDPIGPPPAGPPPAPSPRPRWDQTAGQDPAFVTLAGERP